MIRITKQSDYAVVLLAHLALQGEGLATARDLAGQSHVPHPMVSKILKMLAHGGLVRSQRGAQGGYALAHDPADISVAQVLDVIEGPIGLTECIDTPGACGLEPCCLVRTVWRRIDYRVRAALEDVTLAEMVEPLGTDAGPTRRAGRFPIEAPADGAEKMTEERQ